VVGVADLVLDLGILCTAHHELNQVTDSDAKLDGKHNCVGSLRGV
jgi:hypothetical protein